MGLLRIDLLWSSGTIPYELENAAANPSWAATTQAALADWLAKTELSVVPRTNQSNFVRLRLVPPTGKCHAGGVGNEKKGAQKLECSVQDPESWSVYSHEFAHTIGFGHEHQRFDRAKYVDVDDEAGKADPYDILDTPGQWSAFGTYDCVSVSHYREDAFLKPRAGGCPNIGTIGGASEGDIISVRAAYNLTAAAGLIGPQSALSRKPGGIDVFARWTNNAIHTATWQGGWKGWWRLGPAKPSPFDMRAGYGMSPPTAVSRTADTIDVFLRQLDDSIAATTWTGSNWTPWRRLDGGKGLSAVAAIRRDDTSHDVLVRGLDARAWHTTMQATADGPSCTGWKPIHTQLLTSDIALARTSSGTLHAVARGVDGVMVTARRPQGGSWSQWRTLPGTTALLGSTPVLVARGNTVDLVVIDGNCRVRGTATHDDGVKWKGWWTVGDVVVHPRAGLAMVARTPKHLDLVTVDVQGYVRHARWDASSPNWQSWQPVTNFRVARATGLALVSRKSGQLDLFAVGMDGRTWTAWWSETAWGGPRPVKAE